MQFQCRLQPARVAVAALQGEGGLPLAVDTVAPLPDQSQIGGGTEATDLALQQQLGGNFPVVEVPLVLDLEQQAVVDRIFSLLAELPQQFQLAGHQTQRLAGTALANQIAFKKESVAQGAPQAQGVFLHTLAPVLRALLHVDRAPFQIPFQRRHIRVIHLVDRHPVGQQQARPHGRQPENPPFTARHLLFPRNGNPTRPPDRRAPGSTDKARPEAVPASPRNPARQTAIHQPPTAH